MKHSKLLFLVLFVLTVSVLFVGAAFAATYEIQGPDELNVDSYAYYEVYESENYSYYNYPQVTWSVDNEEVARISKYGDLYGIKGGTVKITAVVKPDEESESVTVTKSVTIKSETIPVKSISFTTSKFTVNVGEGFSLDSYMMINPDNATGYQIYYTSSDEDVAYAGGSWISGVGDGTATITVTVVNSDGSEVTGSVQVTVKDENAPLKSIAFKKSEYTLSLNKKKYDNIYFTVNPVYAVFDSDDLEFTSSDESVLEVQYHSDNYVYVRAIKPGTVTLTVTYADNDAITASTTVKVETVPITSVKMNREVINYTEDNYLYYTGSAGIQLNIQPSNAYVESVEWISSDPTIVSVGNSDVDYCFPSVRFYKTGSVTITARVSDGSTVKEASCIVNVNAKAPALRIVDWNEKSVSAATLYLHKAARENKRIYKLTAQDMNGSSEWDNTEDVWWTSSDVKIATVDRNGYVTVKKPGKVTITAISKKDSSATASVKITVKKLLISKLTGNKVITLKVGWSDNVNNYIVIKPTSQLANLFYSKLSFKSNKTKIVSVNSNGVIVANKVGKAVITVKTMDGSNKIFKITVIVVPDEVK